MPGTGCPCGATVAPAYSGVAIVTHEMLDVAIPDLGEKAAFLPLLLSFLQNTIDLTTLCSLPREPRPRDFTAFDWINPAIGAQLAWKWLRYKGYEFFCECSECPPIDDCGEGDYSLVVDPEMAYYTSDVATISQFHIGDGAEIYVQRSDGVCYGLHNGVWVYFGYNHRDGEIVSICVRDGSDTPPGHCWVTVGGNPGVVLWFGNGQEPVTDPWAKAPPEVEQYPGPPSCTNDDICATLSEVTRQVHEMRFLLDVVAGPLYGVTTGYEFDIPGLNTPIAGTLADTLPRVIRALAPMAPDQLENEDTTAIDVSSLVELSGQVWGKVTLTEVPDRLGSRDDGAQLTYWNTNVVPAPARVLIIGADGIMAELPVRYGDGIEFAISTMATHLAIGLQDGVTAELRTWERHV